MRAYIGVKIVLACKITDIKLPHLIGNGTGDRWGLVHSNGQVVYVSQAYMDKHKPKLDGYFVEYPDGYQSFSPADTFEAAYREVTDAEASLAENNLSP